MVRRHFSLLAVTLATGAALASSNDYQRHSELDVNDKVHPQLHLRFGLACAKAFGQNKFQSRGFEDEEDLFVRELDTFDDLEAREPFNLGGAFKVGKKVFSSGQKAAKFGKKVAGHQRTRKAVKGAKRVAKGANRAANGVEIGQQIYSTIKSRGLEDNEDLFGRDLDAEEDLFVRDLDTFDDLEAREPFNLGGAFKVGKKVFSSGKKAAKFGKKVAGHQRTIKAVKGAKRVAKGANRAANGVEIGQQVYSTIKSRGLEDNEDLFGRDLDAEEIFGREYDLLDERDTIDDLD